MPTISFLILTYNSSHYFKNLFSSIEKEVGSEIKNGLYEVIIVDNASTDGSSEEIKKYVTSNIYFFQNDKNCGYAKGINVAASHATGEILIVINPDATLATSDFEKVIGAFHANKKLAIAGLVIEKEEGKREKTAGKFYNLFTILLFCLGVEDAFGLRFSPKKERQVDYVSGGFVAFRTEAYKKLKGFDEDYFMYVEDMDICYRARQMGYETRFIPFAKIIHKGQGSSSREFAIVNIYKGLITFYEKHASFLMVQCVKNLLSIKAASIIFLGSVLDKKDLVSTYTKALKTIS
ncbi:MAG: glycosyltransferase family 2 protein [Candidatus Levybacteria bacterium]|nr:glycosyltransferase family 2 protein [Candidatus Levybacteria bacterium]